jgi:hypothetical protein
MERAQLTVYGSRVGITVTPKRVHYTRGHVDACMALARGKLTKIEFYGPCQRTVAEILELSRSSVAPL